MTKKIDSLIFYLILLFPFLDFATGILTWEGIGFSIGLITKGIFLIFTIIYLLKNYPNKKIFLCMGFYFIIYFLYLLFNNKNLVMEITNSIKIFYLPVLILFFTTYENSKINKKTITLLLLSYLLLYLMPAICGLGHNINEVYPNKDLYLSYFYIGNELVNVFLILIPTTILYLLESNSYILKALYFFLIMFTIMILGTKVFYAGIGIILLYFVILKRKEIIKIYKKNQLKVLLCTAVLFAGIIIYMPNMDLYKNIKTQFSHYGIESPKDLVKLENIDHVIYSSRLTFLDKVNAEYKESNTLEKVFGLGRKKIENINVIEIDIFDIFYSIGMIGTAFYIIFFGYVLKQNKLKPVYKFTFILLIVVSCFSGHVLLSPMVTSYMALLFLVSKNDNGKAKKNILLISNMYPSKSYPHYGIFVKNTYELLRENGYTLDKIVMFKTNNILKKIGYYIAFYTKSFIKAVLNNYDFIYVHFISHSCKGIIIPYLCSKNTKLVLNVHGNDIVADYEFEKKNEIHSANYLKHADVVISPSNYFKKVLIQKYHIKENKIVVYPSGGVNQEKFKKIPQKIAIQNARLQEKIKYFGYVSRIEKDKGYDTLLLAINVLKKQKKLQNIKFLIVGSGKEEGILEAGIKQYELQEYIERRPLVSQDELVNIYNSIEALIYPTRRKSESLGLTGLEAMACQTLVIGSNTYGPSDYLIDKVNSITFNPADAKELSKKLEEVINMPEKEKKKLQTAAKQKSEEYSFERTKDTLLNVFKSKKS